MKIGQATAKFNVLTLTAVIINCYLLSLAHGASKASQAAAASREFHLNFNNFFTRSIEINVYRELQLV